MSELTKVLLFPGPFVQLSIIVPTTRSKVKEEERKQVVATGKREITKACPRFLSACQKGGKVCPLLAIVKASLLPTTCTQQYAITTNRRSAALIWMDIVTMEYSTPSHLHQHK